MPKILRGAKGGRTLAGLEQLFGSRTRFNLLKIFCNDPERTFFVRELSRLADNQLNAVRREVANLCNIGIIEETPAEEPKKRFYRLNTNFILSKEINSLIMKSEFLAEKSLINIIKELGTIDLCVFTGVLMKTDAPCDILIVGKIDKDDLAKHIMDFEKETGKLITYTIFSPEEYKSRKALTDKFLFTVLESKKIVAIDKYGEFAGQNFE